MAALCRKTLKILRFFWKTTPYGKVFKIMFRKFSSRHQSTCCIQTSWKMADGKSVKSCVVCLTKKKQNRRTLLLSLLRGSHPKSARASPGQCVLPVLTMEGNNSSDASDDPWQSVGLQQKSIRRTHKQVTKRSDSHSRYSDLYTPERSSLPKRRAKLRPCLQTSPRRGPHILYLSLYKCGTRPPIQSHIRNTDVTLTTRRRDESDYVFSRPHRLIYSRELSRIPAITYPFVWSHNQAFCSITISTDILQMYSEFSRFHPNRFTFGGVVAECVNTAKTRRTWIQYSAEAYLRAE